MLGTIVNALAVIGGCIIGLLVNGRMSEKISETIMKGLALCVIYMGITGALKGEDTLQMIICIAVGALIGEIIDIDQKLNNLGKSIENKFNKSKKENAKKVSIADGFITSSLLFCVGAMAVVGSLESGLNGNYNTLFAKSVLDGISSIIFTSSLGIGVIFSAIVIVIYQGSITLLAGMLSGVLNTGIINNMTAVGSILILGLGLNMLDIGKIRIANLLPAIFLPIGYPYMVNIINSIIS